MRKQTMQFNHKRGLAIKAGDKPLKTNEEGLVLKSTQKNGVGSWMFRFTSPITKKRREIIIGKFPDKNLSEVKQEVMELRQIVEAGGDPLEERMVARLQKGTGLSLSDNQIPTFEQAARERFEIISQSFKHPPKPNHRWIRSLELYVFKYIGNMPVDQISVKDFAKALSAIWMTKPETARRVKQRCSEIMDTQLAYEHISLNPLSIVDKILPKQVDRVVHQPAIEWQELPDFVKKHLSEQPLFGTKAALLFTILTLGRSGEVRYATWKEIDFENKLWVIPEERMKAKRLHRVPLSQQAIELLEHQKAVTLGGKESFIFQNIKGKPLSDAIMSKFMRTNEIESDTQGRYATPHGFRSTFRNWAADNKYNYDDAERALAHTISNAVQAAYERTDRLEARISMMQDWADYAFSKISSTKSLENEIANEPQATVEEAFPIDTHTGYSSDSKADSKPLDITKPKHVVLERKNQTTIKSASPDKKIVPVEVRKKRISSKP